jgi:hypothetical protein
MERATTTGILAANAVLAAQHRPTHQVLQPRRPEPLVLVLSGLVRGIRLAFRPVIAGLRWLRRINRKHSAVKGK